MITSYYFITVLMLLWNTIRDFKTSYIDERFNYLCFGATLMLMAYIKTNLIIIFSLIAFAVVLNIFLRKYFASGDLQALTWIYLGLGSISFFKLIFFNIIFIILYISILIILRVFKINLKYIPAYGILLGAYIITVLYA